MKRAIDFRALVLACSIVLSPMAAHAMDATIVDDTLILSGPVIQGDVQRFDDALASRPGITTVVLRNSWGGHIESGYRIGERIRAQGLSTMVSGYCVSSCSRMFLGGRQRQFSKDYGLQATFVGFHGHYDAIGKLIRKQVERRGLLDWIIKHSDGKADRELVKRWISIGLNTGMVAFMHPDSKTLFRSETTFFCQGREKNRPLGCDTIASSALDLGVITDLATPLSPDK